MRRERVVLHIFREDYPIPVEPEGESSVESIMREWRRIYREESRIRVWCFAHGADEFAIQSTPDHSPIPQLMKKPDFSLSKYKSRTLEIWKEQSEHPPLHIPSQIPSTLRPFHIGIRNRAIIHPYHGSTTCHPIDVYRLDEDSLGHLAENQYGDTILYRNSVLMFAMVDHEDEGFLVMVQSEVKRFMKIGIGWRDKPEWVGYDKFEPGERR